MFKKYISIVPALFLVGCSWSSAPSDFSGMYRAHVTKQLDSVHQVAEDIGIGKKYMIDGSTKFGANVPGYMSGILSMDYTSKIDGRDVEFTGRKFLLGYEAFIASGSISLDALGITSKGGDTYFFFKDLAEHNMLSPRMLEVFQKYNAKWLSLTKADIESSLSGGTLQDVLSYKLSESLSSLTLDEVKERLNKYPLFQEVGDLGNSGSLHQYAVSLNAPNIVSLIDDFSLRLTGSGLSSDDRSTLTKDFASVSSSGTVSFDPKDATYINLDLMLSSSDMGTTRIMLKEAKNEFGLTLKTNVTTLSLSAVKSENGDQNSTLSLSQGDKEIAKLVALFKYEDGRMNELDLTMSAPSQGLTMNLIEKNAKDGSFEGNMNAGIGNATWTGKVDHRALMALHLHGAVVGTTLAVDLEAKNGDMIYGPLVMKSGNTIDFAADIGLRVTPERFSLSIDTALPSDGAGSGATEQKAHFDADIIAKRSGFSGNVETPKAEKTFREFIKDIDAIAPAEESFQETPPEESLSGTPGMGSGTVIQGTVSN